MKQQADHDAGAASGTGNALLKDWETPFAAPPFAEIGPEHFRPAFDAALAEHRAEVDRDRGEPGASRPSTTPSTRWS